MVQKPTEKAEASEVTEAAEHTGTAATPAATKAASKATATTKAQAVAKAQATAAPNLQRLKGVGAILEKRLIEAGMDSYARIAKAGEEELKKVPGMSPRAVGSILEQAKLLAKSGEPRGVEREQAVKKQVSEVREKVQTLAQLARERFQEELSGKSGKKLSADLTRFEDALGRMDDGGSKRKGAGKALVKAEKRVSGLEEASLKKLRKGLKRARKSVLKALR